jgi:hypothetical protein
MRVRSNAEPMNETRGLFKGKGCGCGSKDSTSAKGTCGCGSSSCGRCAGDDIRTPVFGARQGSSEFEVFGARSSGAHLPGGASARLRTQSSGRRSTGEIRPTLQSGQAASRRANIRILSGRYTNPLQGLLFQTDPLGVLEAGQVRQRLPCDCDETLPPAELAACLARCFGGQEPPPPLFPPSEKPPLFPPPEKPPYRPRVDESDCPCGDSRILTYNPEPSIWEAFPGDREESAEALQEIVLREMRRIQRSHRNQSCLVGDCGHIPMIHPIPPVGRYRCSAVCTFSASFGKPVGPKETFWGTTYFEVPVAVQGRCECRCRWVGYRSAVPDVMSTARDIFGCLEGVLSGKKSRVAVECAGLLKKLLEALND